MKTKKEYIAPRLTVVSFKTETGYASSLTMLLFWYLGSSDTDQMEAYETVDGWDSGNNTFWN